MVGPIRFDGPVSGIDFTSIITQLLAAQRRPEEALKNRIQGNTDKKTALLDVNVSLLGLQSSIQLLSRPSFFSQTKASSNNEAILTASGTGAPAGTYTFTVRQVAQAHQLISNGFPDASSTPVTTTAGTLKIELGGGSLERRTPLSLLNAQSGFDRGSIRITDSAGNAAVIDLRGVATVQDVLDEINTSSDVSVTASADAGRLVIRDNAGGGGTLKVENSGSDATAASLGIAGSAVTTTSGQFIFGTQIGTVDGSTSLRLLNDGLGVRQAAGTDFSITDAHGITFAVDLQGSDNTLQKVVDRLNTAATGAGSTLVASLAQDGAALVLGDATGGGSISVTPASGAFAAADLGLGSYGPTGWTQVAAEDATTGATGGAGTRLVGRSLLPSLNSTLRGLLNGGQTNTVAAERKGVADGSITLTDRAGHPPVSVDVSSRVETSATGFTSTSVNVASTNGFAVGNRIRLQTSAGAEYRTVTEISGATVRFDRALAGTVTTGDAVYALNDSLSDILRTVNQAASAAGVQVRVGLNGEGNGLSVTDLSGASASSLTVSGAPATDLGIAGSIAASVLKGTDLDVQYLGENTALSSLNGGQGVAAGQIRILDTAAHAFSVSLAGLTVTALGQVLTNINGAASAAGSGVRARINDTGDGVLLEDTTPGSGVLQVQEVNNGRTARDLNLLGAASATSPAKIDGTFEYSIAVAANAKLQDVATAINNRGIPVSATVINDGSTVNPARLTLTSGRAGESGRMTVSSTISGLSFSTTARAQDTVLLSGSGGPNSEPALITTSGTTLKDIVPGLTLQVHSASAGPVSLTVTHDPQAVVDQVQKFVDSYNAVVQKIQGYTTFDADTFETGPLFSETAVRRLQRDLANLVSRPVEGILPGGVQSLAEVGVKLTSVGSLAFNSSALSAKLQDSFDQVESLFILQRRITSTTALNDLNAGSGIRDTSGADFKVHARNGTTFSVDLGGATTVGSVLSAINGAPGNGGLVHAQISSDGFSLELVDSSLTELNPLSVTAVGGAPAASQLKILLAAPSGQNVLKGGLIGLRGDPGVASRFNEHLDAVTRAGDGSIATRTAGLDKSSKDLNKSIDAIEKRALTAQENLVRKFTKLEQIIAQSQSTQARLSGLLSGILAGNGTN